MALRAEEALRAKAECGYNIVGVGAEIYLLEGYVSLFDRAVQPYLIDYQTTSTTAVPASTTGTSVALTLAANPPIVGSSTQTLAFVQGSNIVVDTGPLNVGLAETSVVQSISGLAITCTLFNAHGMGGVAYPVLLQGSEQIIRDIFLRLDAIKYEMLNVAPKTAGVEQVDEVKIYPGSSGGRRGTTRNKIDDLVFQRDVARDDLCFALGIPNLWNIRRSRLLVKHSGGGGGGGGFEAY
jgi:hypothetical protein